MSETKTIICFSCGINNEAGNTICTGCGSVLAAGDLVQAVPPTTPVKPAKNKLEQRPPWLNTLLIIFGLYAAAMVVMEWQNLPSGSVQSNMPEAAAETPAPPTDPTLISRLTSVEEQLKREPKNAELRLQFANMLHDAKFYPRAVEAYKQYLVLQPENADARVDMGICYFETGDLDKAVKEIEGVIAAHPKHQMAMFNLGIIQLTAQNMPEAKRWFTKCMELDPQSTAGLRARQILQQHQ